MLSTVIDYFNDRGSNVYVAGLDVAKAFDRVNHYGIFIKLMNVQVPLSKEHLISLIKNY